MDISEDIFLVNVTHWLSTERESELSGKSIVMLLEKKNYWSHLVLDFAISKNVNYLVFCGMGMRRNKGVLFAYHFIRICAEILVSFVKARKAGSTPSEIKIGIPLCLTKNVTNFFDLRNYDLFWFYKSEINPDRVLLYVLGGGFSVDEREVSNIKENRFNVTSCQASITRKGSGNVSVHTCTFKAAVLLIQYLRQIMVMHRHTRSKFMKEQWKIVSLLLIQLPYWEDFFRTNNIKIK